jgi:hypothetical protein
MKKTIKQVLAGLLLVPVLALGVGAVSVTPAGAAPVDQITSGINATTDNQGSTTSLSSVFKTVVNVLLFVIGAVSVVMLIVGGIRYTLSAGNSSAVTAAKNTIMYAIIGLVIAFLAYAIINWVLGALQGNAATS